MARYFEFLSQFYGFHLTHPRISPLPLSGRGEGILTSPTIPACTLPPITEGHNNNLHTGKGSEKRPWIQGNVSGFSSVQPGYREVTAQPPRYHSTIFYKIYYIIKEKPQHILPAWFHKIVPIYISQQPTPF
jgi:hypothetical protein